ncbi:hypothetical protein POX_e07007 [Penicillium oxalicum]|uniref:hypothetical protein n=1 Tax=Penicillium oxalicum TaxID=69781 RepID=UPI0020B8FB7C|nr:hypothetical protein POX_e07007 [Penicillium oxalicum]KAI2788982.1 hypothetical protein POX_e07007 [Penicillium oxalicum]
MTTGDLLTKLRIAIKEPHTSIHKLNLSRIPLCLPPYTTDPGLYAVGLAQYAELFYVIESAWISLIGDPMDWMYQDPPADIHSNSNKNCPSSCDLDKDGEDLSNSANLTSHSTRCSHVRHNNDDHHHHHHHITRIQNVLRAMYMPELMRSRALGDDLRFIQALGTTTLQPASSLPCRDSPPESLQDRQCDQDHDHDHDHDHNHDHDHPHAPSHSPRELISIIQHRIQAHPHLLIAYIWILYSALLYGGRDIRTLLLKAGPDFWGLSTAELPSPPFGSTSKKRQIPCPLSFWQIGGVDDDGAEIKSRFRSRMVEVERALSPTEQEEILHEAVGIFGMMEDITRGLDEQVQLGSL